MGTQDVVGRDSRLFIENKINAAFFRRRNRFGIVLATIGVSDVVRSKGRKQDDNTRPERKNVVRRNLMLILVLFIVASGAVFADLINPFNNRSF